MEGWKGENSELLRWLKEGKTTGLYFNIERMKFNTKGNMMLGNNPPFLQYNPF